MPFSPTTGTYSLTMSDLSVAHDMGVALTSLGTGQFAPPTTPVTLANGLNSNITAPATNRVVIAGPTGAFSIGGFTGGTDGERLWIFNPLSQIMTIVNEDASSTAANRITTLTGSNIVLNLNSGSLSFVTMSYNGATSRWIVESTNGGLEPSVPNQAYKTNSNASGAVTLTAAQCTGGALEVWINCTGTQAGGFAINLPTVSTLVTAMQAANINPIAGGTYILNVMATNGAAQTGTITTNTGWTLTGTMTVADATYRKLLVTFTSLSAFAAQSLGEYAITAGI